MSETLGPGANLTASSKYDQTKSLFTPAHSSKNPAKFVFDIAACGRIEPEISFGWLLGDAPYPRKGAGCKCPRENSALESLSYPATHLPDPSPGVGSREEGWLMDQEKRFVFTEGETESHNGRLDSVQNCDHGSETEEWLAIGDWLAAGERWVFSLGAPQPLFKER